MPPGRAPTSSNTTGGCAKKTVVPNTLLCDGVFFAEGEKGTLGFWPLPPLELLGKLTALTPRPRINLVLYHGVLAPHAGWRSRVVAYRAPQVEAPAVASASANANGEPAAAPPSRHWAWADLMRRAFDIDVLACPRCGGRMRLIGTVEDPDAIRSILAASRCRESGRIGRRRCRVAGHQLRCCDRRLSAIRAPRTPRSAHQNLQRSLGPLTGPLSALYVGGRSGKSHRLPRPGNAPEGRGASEIGGVYVAYARPDQGVHAVEAKAGLLWAYPRAADGAAGADLGAFTWQNGFVQIVFSEVPCNWFQCQENSIDPEHFEWLHSNWSRTLGAGTGGGWAFARWR